MSMDGIPVSSELANGMSLFYAQATPMLRVLSEATSKFVNEHKEIHTQTTETLGTMAQVCQRMLETPGESFYASVVSKYLTFVKKMVVQD